MLALISFFVFSCSAGFCFICCYLIARQKFVSCYHIVKLQLISVCFWQNPKHFLHFCLLYLDPLHLLTTLSLLFFDISSPPTLKPSIRIYPHNHSHHALTIIPLLLFDCSPPPTLNLSSCLYPHRPYPTLTICLMIPLLWRNLYSSLTL